VQFRASQFAHVVEAPFGFEPAGVERTLKKMMM
jgi:hypothetical protein